MSDTGTFRAVSPDQGGFLDASGNPVDTSNHLDDSALVTQAGHSLPMFEEEPGATRHCFFRTTFVFITVVLVIVLLIFFLLQNGSGPALGDANNILNLLEN